MTNRRLLVIQWFFLIWFIVILTRLIYWQVIKSKELQEEASNQHLATLILPAPRGQILSSDGLPLVGNQDNYLLYVNPKKLPTDISSLLSITDSLPSTQSSQLLLQAKSSNLSWVSISRSALAAPLSS
jgi:cell division protein FtsI/penicillin-binding protein 2